MDNGPFAEVMSLDEFLGQRGLSSPVSDFLLDKTRFPHGMTLRQRNQFEKEAEKAELEYSAKRQAAIAEYSQLVAEGKFREPSRIETLLRNAQGHEDNPATHAARRALEKRGVDWRTGNFIVHNEGENNMVKYNAIGYFMETGVWSGGVELPPQKCPIILIDTGLRSLTDVGPNENIRVLSREMNWYTIQKSELFLNNDLQKINVAIESTDDYAEPGFCARLVDVDIPNEDGTYGRVIESYRIVKINENGRIDRFDERVFSSFDEAKAAVLENAELSLVGYDELVHEAGKGLGFVLADAQARAAEGVACKSSRGIEIVKE